MRVPCHLLLMSLMLGGSTLGAHLDFHAASGRDSGSIAFEAVTAGARQHVLSPIVRLLGISNGEPMSVASISIDQAELTEIPGHKSYRYAVVGDQRFIVDAASHAIIYTLN